MDDFETISVERDGAIGRVVLDRPERINAIVEPMPRELRRAVEALDDDPRIRVIVLRGAGDGFCSGYDLEVYAETPGPNPGQQDMPWDPMVDLRLMGGYTDDFMSIWRSQTPVIAQVHGAAVAGGSDIALCCDQIVMADDAVIGYPPARVWGMPTTMMWVYRVGLEQAKRLLLTGDLIDGEEAARIGLVAESVPVEQLAERVGQLAHRIATVPASQLAMAKTAVNQAYEQMGLSTTQLLATLFDGIARHSPEGVAFKQRAEQVGWKRAVDERDQG
ncbi:MAG: crotonase/enoyl-CoA hydratase family protein [Nitriliruptoraceae bacterium]